jgi:hypothetical protein
MTLESVPTSYTIPALEKTNLALEFQCTNQNKNILRLADVRKYGSIKDA